MKKQPPWFPLALGLLMIGFLSAGFPAGAAEERAGPKGHAQYTNHLIDSGSPYLLRHAHNPVDWYPWGPEALDKARRENKPIFLSVGYSTCYWCHVAERTLYSNPEIAKLMNQWFVNIKVDREQRPDLDAVYMLATQIMTGKGGWPNNVFLTPDLKPFFGGSYFPPHDDEFGRPGFVTVLRAIHREWTERPEETKANAEKVARAMREVGRREKANRAPVDPASWRKAAVERLASRFDERHGGFADRGEDSKFPQEPALFLLIADYQLTQDPVVLARLTRTLDAMAYGGIHDHLGGGFHRYTLDSAWSLPHFEKMLYNNAQLLELYAKAFALTGNRLYHQVAEDTAAYLLRRMTAPGGGFYTAQDAEVDGREGASYLWSRQEIEAVLGPEAARRFFRVYALAPLAEQEAESSLKGEEQGVLRLRDLGSSDVAAPMAALAPERAKLLAIRDQRPQPVRDEKIVVALNGLAIEAFARAGRILKRPDYVTAARRAAERLWNGAYDGRKGILAHEIFRGKAQGAGFLDDYALFGLGLLALHDATGEKIWQERAALLADDLLRFFARGDGGLAVSSIDGTLPVAPEDLGDDTYPSGTSAALELLFRLGGTRTAAAEGLLRNLSPELDRAPEYWPSAIAAASLYRREPTGGPQGLPGTADHVRAAAKLQPWDGYDEVSFQVTIDPGYHVNANPASFDYLIPTALDFSGVQPLAIDYPKPVRFKPAFAKEGIDVYQGTVEIVARLPKGALKPGAVATLTAQACDDETCLPPAKIPVPVNRKGTAR